MTHEFHTPVMAHRAVELLLGRPEGRYIDATYGGGGHARRILEALSEQGRLLAFDRDLDAWRGMPDDLRLLAVHHDFRFVSHFAAYAGWAEVDGILADLGVSSHQFDTGARGFSFRYEGPLDMRMDTQSGESAAEWLATAAPESLQQVLQRYGDVPQAGKVTRYLVQARANRRIATTGDLVAALEPLGIPAHKQHKYLARIFQALRIAVNGELEALQALLTQAAALLRPGGRLVVIAYHSAEDKMVKQYFRTGKFAGPQEKNLYGETLRPLKPLERLTSAPTEEETQRNPRARSARLRVAEKQRAA
jgi:16S rRNA (cytosine1402-N4)-methyltransferase